MTTPTQGEHAQTDAPSVSDGQRTLHEAILNRLSHAELLEKAHYLMELNSNQARTIGELQDLVEAAPAQPAAPQGVAYAELPMQFACSGVFPVYSADQMRAFADGTHALRTKSEASREFLERTLAAMEGVIDVADRKTDEFDALRSCVIDLTLMLFSDAKRHTKGACHER